MKLHIDIETFSSEDIRNVGAYKYMESPDFEILMVAFAFDDNPIQIIDLAAGEDLPEYFIYSLTDPLVEKYAHNANFERNAFKAYGIETDIAQWRCTAIKSLYCGLPQSLEMVSKALKLEEKGKLSTGKALIRYFSVPCKPSKANGMRSRNFYFHDTVKWEEFKRYCIADVEAEREICSRLAHFDIPDIEQRAYTLDQQINDRGVRIDTQLASIAVATDERFSKELTIRIKELTGLQNPNSPAQLKKWLSDATGKDINSLTKAAVTELLNETSDAAVFEVLEGRQMLSKSSTKKYIKMMDCVCADGRAHGLFQFYGANRTGRWAGRLIQLQNLPRNSMEALDTARHVLKHRAYAYLKLAYDNVPKVLSELVRTALIPSEGKTFGVCDFSAIEARVLSWLAGEQWRMDVFNSHGKIYEASAAMMFNIPLESIGKGSEYRQRGKVAELALGYQGGAGAMAVMDTEKKIPQHEYAIIVSKWRRANPSIVKLWKKVEEYAKHALENPGKRVRLDKLTFEFSHNALQIGLPSGRKLMYQEARLTEGRFGPSIVYMGMEQTTKTWGRVDTYGGKLVENIVQAISRDLLSECMLRLDENGAKIVMHIHDEVVVELNHDHEEAESLTLEYVERIMCEGVSWAQGLPLNADGYITNFYKKD